MPASQACFSFTSNGLIMALPLLKALKFRISFVAFWLVLTLIHVIILHRFGFSWPLAFSDGFISSATLAGVTLLVSTILSYYVPVKNKFSYLLVLCTVLCLLWYFVTHLLLTTALDAHENYPTFYAQSVPVRLAFAFLIVGCMALISILWQALQDQQEIDSRKTEAEKLAREAELYNLRQQLQPHFLFNSLNSINALVGSSPQQARSMILQLSDFLRFTLNKEAHQWTNLSDELHHLTLYLNIEKVRFGHRLATEVIDETKGYAKLPIMILQPVVENAIKFGLYDTTDQITITLHAQKEQNYLNITVTNPFDAATATPKPGTGFGLASVKRRLYLLFARNDLVQTNANGQLFTTVIKIPQPQ